QDGDAPYGRESPLAVTASRNRDLGLGIWDSQISNLESQIPNPKSQIPNPESRIPLFTIVRARPLPVAGVSVRHARAPLEVAFERRQHGQHDERDDCRSYRDHVRSEEHTSELQSR